MQDRDRNSGGRLKDTFSDEGERIVDTLKTGFGALFGEIKEIFESDQRDHGTSDSDISELFTLEDLVDFTIHMKKKVKSIRKGKIHIKRIVDGDEVYYRIEQCFVDENSEIVYFNDRKKSMYGRIVYSRGLDEDLLLRLGEKNEILFTI